jgi:DNA helicase-2/ATP-dependent DNA helicase PcrA
LNEKKNPPRGILGDISRAKNELVGVADYARLNRTYWDEIVTRCYERYQALLRESNALDFDDLLMSTVRLFEQHPAVLERYHERYIYLLVDEYQDTNRAQYVLVRQLAAKRRNLFVVGDEDQSIYTWRGADIRNILEFETDYPDAQVFLLEQNYRSSQAIINTARAVISGGAARKHQKTMRALMSRSWRATTRTTKRSG